MNALIFCNVTEYLVCYAKLNIPCVKSVVDKTVLQNKITKFTVHLYYMI